MNKTNLDSVVLSIFSGYSFRGKVESNAQGDIEVIQMKDLKEDYLRIGSDLTKVLSSSISGKYVLQKGDVLFIAKGSNNYALVYNLDLPKAIASSAFFVLRPDTSKVLPEYLAWFINQKPVQQYLKINTAGTYVPNVNKTTISGIQIQLPHKKLQEKITKIDFLRKREYLLMNQLLDKRELLVSNKLMNTVNTNDYE